MFEAPLRHKGVVKFELSPEMHTGRPFEMSPELHLEIHFEIYSTYEIYSPASGVSNHVCVRVSVRVRRCAC